MDLEPGMYVPGPPDLVEESSTEYAMNFTVGVYGVDWTRQEQQGIDY
jgi:hypothetical protein